MATNQNSEATRSEEMKAVGSQSTLIRKAVNDASWMMRAFGASIASACADAAKIHGLTAADVEAAALNGVQS